ncbi:MAG: acylphosphatase [Vicinamibacteria bacterium]|nr:acylphosphatase [Vicinamibacteria bacterium]
MSAEARQYRVVGRVQGVGYRYFALREAETLGVCGHVRNLPDGSVEVNAEASPDALARFEEKLRSGPSFSRVEGLEVTTATARGFAGFHIR